MAAPSEEPGADDRMGSMLTRKPPSVIRRRPGLKRDFVEDGRLRPMIAAGDVNGVACRTTDLVLEFGDTDVSIGRHRLRETPITPSASYSARQPPVPGFAAYRHGPKEATTRSLKRKRFMRIPAFMAFALLGGLLACQDNPTAADWSAEDSSPANVVGAGIPGNAVISFGRDDVGSPFPPPSGHDQSGHARDRLRPSTAIIRAGGSVTFEMGTFHQVAIYDQGVGTGDIDASATVDLTAPPPAPPGTVIIPNFIIDDAAGRLALSDFSFAPMTWTSPPGTFDVPGRYLVICTVVPHFLGANMYGWVIVK